jgi:hypothetical protein
VTYNIITVTARNIGNEQSPQTVICIIRFYWLIACTLIRDSIIPKREFVTKESLNYTYICISWRQMVSEIFDYQRKWKINMGEFLVHPSLFGLRKRAVVIFLHKKGVL